MTSRGVVIAPVIAPEVRKYLKKIYQKQFSRDEVLYSKTEGGSTKTAFFLQASKMTYEISQGQRSWTKIPFVNP